jgi:hypothetical protein
MLSSDEDEDEDGDEGSLGGSSSCRALKSSGVGCPTVSFPCSGSSSRGCCSSCSCSWVVPDWSAST